METYIPTTPSGGILGGKGADGELDSIQAWKKGMKEKERKEKGEFTTDTKGSDSNGAPGQTTSPTAPALPNPDSPMDEIQLFKIMMKREAEKKEGEKVQNGHTNHALAESGPPGLSSSPSLQSQKSEGGSVAGAFFRAPSTQFRIVERVTPDPAIVTQRSSEVPRALNHESNKSSPRPDFHTGGNAGNPQSALPLDSTRPSQSSSPSFDRSSEVSRVVGPRLGQVTPGIPPSAANAHALPPIDLSSPTSSTSTFNPPPGSRVLALKSRVPSGGSGAPPAMNQFPPGIAAPHAHALSPGASGPLAHLSEAVPYEMQFGGPRMPPSDSSRGIRSSPLSQGSQPNVSLDDLRESLHLGQMNEGLRRTSGSSAAERAIFGHPSEAGSPFGELGGPQSGAFPAGVPLDPSAVNLPGGGNYAANKGSRFAKFFDSKTREAQAAGPRLGQQVPGMPPAIPHHNPNPREALGGLAAPRGERTMEDIFAMLQSSAQVSTKYIYSCATADIRKRVIVARHRFPSKAVYRPKASSRQPLLNFSSCNSNSSSSSTNSNSLKTDSSPSMTAAWMIGISYLMVLSLAFVPHLLARAAGSLVPSSSTNKSTIPCISMSSGSRNNATWSKCTTMGQCPRRCTTSKQECFATAAFPCSRANSAAPRPSLSRTPYKPHRSVFLQG